MTLRVLIADDQQLVRAGFRRLVESESDFEVVAEVSDGDEAVAAAARTRPDVVLMDIRMPRVDGITATERIVAASGSVRVLILTTYDLDEYVFKALRAGASGFLLKDAPPEHLIDAIRIVASGDALLAPSVTRRLVAEFSYRPEPHNNPELATLTARERETLELMGQGLSNSEIAKRLFVAEATVKTHVTNVLTKTGCRDRVQAVVFAYETGVLRPGQGSGSGSTG
ncbi:MAG: response regulator transcription factor [Acidimicrobiales bacterium]|nr:response regulator transcription factor [Acidimicrobiales bacterium]